MIPQTVYPPSGGPLSALPPAPVPTIEWLFVAMPLAVILVFFGYVLWRYR